LNPTLIPVVANVSVNTAASLSLAWALSSDHQ
jgi:hypothetical protein